MTPPRGKQSGGTEIGLVEWRVVILRVLLREACLPTPVRKIAQLRSRASGTYRWNRGKARLVRVRDRQTSRSEGIRPVGGHSLTVIPVTGNWSSVQKVA